MDKQDQSFIVIPKLAINDIIDMIVKDNINSIQIKENMDLSGLFGFMPDIVKTIIFDSVFNQFK